MNSTVVTPDIQQSLNALTEQACHGNHRLMVILEGSIQWSEQILDHYLQANDLSALRICSNKEDGINQSDVIQYLGQEFDVLAFSLHEGLLPNALAQAEGLLKGGSLFFLQTPSIDILTGVEDAFYSHYPLLTSEQGSRPSCFIRRLSDILIDDATVSVISESGESRISNWQGTTQTELVNGVDQQDAIESIVHVAHGHRNRPLLLLANRGYGKSAALGMACARLMKSGTSDIVVTAPSKGAVAVLYKHVMLELGIAAGQSGSTLEYASTRLRFVAPDELIRHPLKTEILMVDECAAIPSSLIQGLLAQYHRIVFSGTVYGYEGSGRGFELSFARMLDDCTPGWKKISLNMPIRWGLDDPLSALMARVFLYESRTLPDSRQEITAEQINYKKLSANDIASQEKLLAALYSLLNSSHYKTSPNDLRLLFDSTSTQIFYAEKNDLPVAVALCVKEGELDAALEEGIANGQRRLKGHILPQSLLSEYGQSENIAAQKFIRIMRIAVHPALQGKGVGSHLLKALDRHYAKQQDFIGVSYGVDAELFAFWNKNGYVPVKTGFKRNTYTGLYSMVMLKAYSQRGQELINDYSCQYLQNMLHNFPDQYRFLDTGLSIKLLQSSNANNEIELTESDHITINAYIHSRRQLLSCAHAIYKLILKTLFEVSRRNEPVDFNILFQRVIQRQDEQVIIQQHKLQGRKELSVVMKKITQDLLIRLSQ